MSETEAILVLDMLNDFVTGTLKCDRAQPIIPVLGRLLEGARSAGVPIVYCGDAHLPQDFELRVWGEHAMAGTPGAHIAVSETTATSAASRSRPAPRT